MKIKSFKNIFRKTPRWGRRVLGVLGLIAIVFIGNFLYGLIGGRSVYYQTYDGNPFCNVLGINIHGDIYTYIPRDSDGNPLPDYEDAVASEDIIYNLKTAEDDPMMEAVAFEVDSLGGSPVAGQEIMEAIKHLKKPTVAFIRDTGDSAAYMAISGADKIFASKFSDVGSIGVTMSYLSNVGANQKEGYNYEQLTAGKFKDSGSPDKALTAEERALFQRDLKIMYEDFVKMVSENRKLPIEDVRKIADGSTVLGAQAKDIGLIDEIGGIYEVEDYLKSVIGEDPEICWE